MQKLIAILCLALTLLGCSNQNKGEKAMKEEVVTTNGIILELDEKGMPIIGSDEELNPHYTQKLKEAILQTNQIRLSSPYSTYTPSYLNPSDSRDRSYFLGWRDLYLKEPAKGSIAPWSKEEKEYYLSLKSKKERYIYLVKRSGLKCAIIDIPEEAIGNAKDFPEITALVEANRNTLKSDLHMGEWGICAGILGDAVGFTEATAVGSVRSGFKARGRASSFLYFQLTGDLVGLYERYEFGGGGLIVEE